jgi:hypothetical protein
MKRFWQFLFFSNLNRGHHRRAAESNLCLPPTWLRDTLILIILPLPLPLPSFLISTSYGTISGERNSHEPMERQCLGLFHLSIALCSHIYMPFPFTHFPLLFTIIIKALRRSLLCMPETRTPHCNRSHLLLDCVTLRSPSAYSFMSSFTLDHSLFQSSSSPSESYSLVLFIFVLIFYDS